MATNRPPRIDLQPAPAGVIAVQGRSNGDLLRAAFQRRAEHAVSLIAASASPEALARALEAPTDFGALASALGGTVLVGSALDLDPSADALARGTVERERLALAAGGLLSAEQMGRVLGGITRQAVDKRRRARTLLAIQVAGDWRYPAVQVNDDGKVPPSFLLILAAANEAGMNGWVMLDFLLAPDAALDGMAPIEAIRRGGLHSVLRLLNAARSDSFG